MVSEDTEVKFHANCKPISNIFPTHDLIWDLFFTVGIDEIVNTQKTFMQDKTLLSLPVTCESIIIRLSTFFVVMNISV
jgi:hypothetical protein